MEQADKSALIHFLMGAKEKHSFRVIDRCGGRLLCFYIPPSIETLKERISAPEMDLNRAAERLAKRTGMNQDEARRKINERHKQLLKEEMARLETLPDLVRDSIQSGVEDLNFIARARIMEGLGSDLRTGELYQQFPTETRLRKGKIQKTIILPRHRPKGSEHAQSFEQFCFLEEVKETIRKLATERKTDRIGIGAVIKKLPSSRLSGDDAANVFRKKLKSSLGIRKFDWGAFVQNALNERDS